MEVFQENTILQEIVALTVCESHWEICRLVSDICSAEGRKKSVKNCTKIRSGKITSPGLFNKTL